MKLKELADTLGLRLLTPDGGEQQPQRAGKEIVNSSVFEQEVTRGYASDLLSDVLANAPVGSVLVTLQVHLNVIAVATHAGLCAVIFSCGRMPEAEVVERAAEEGLVLYSSAADTFDLVGRLYQLGLRGSTELPVHPG